MASFLWIGCFKWFGYPYIAGVLIGFVIGFAIRFAPPTRHRAVPALAIVLTILAALAGFVLTDQLAVSWVAGKGPTISRSFVRFFQILPALLFTGIGCYVAYTLTTKNT